MCVHLIGSENTNHVRLLTGHGLDADLCCPACDRAMQAGEAVDLLVACEGCVDRCLEDPWNPIAWRGTPGTTDRPEPLDTTVITTTLPTSVVDLSPVTAASTSVWLVLDNEGGIGRFDADSGTWETLARCTVPAEPDHEEWAGHQLRQRLHASTDGRYAAVVNDYGCHGQVLDLSTGSVTATLHGGTYHSNTVPFSVAFTVHDGRPVLIHRTEWNRLDITDAATGRLLTEREPVPPSPDNHRPEHYLDYFHGALWLSPSGRYIADDGWVWHPVGVPTVWDVHAWLGSNVWESEDGPSRESLCYRNYHWSSPMCWLDDERLVVSGIGSDDETLLTGVRIFNANTQAELTAFAGPTGALFATAARLYASAPDGPEVWDPVTGARTGAVPGFVPTHHHTGAGELAAVEGEFLYRWRI